jgi:putative modified peptide
MSFKLPEPIVDALLEKLGHDDAFRTRFTADPRGALIALGFEPAADATIHQGIWNCLTVSELASKEAICAGHGELREQLSRRGVFYAFSLQATSVPLERVALSSTVFLHQCAPNWGALFSCLLVGSG